MKIRGKKVFTHSKTINIVFAVYIVCCILYTIILSGKTEKTYITENYGLERQDTIELSQDVELKVDFSLNHNNFEGIQVKFLSDYGFKEEKIEASLFDKKTDKLLAKDTVELKYEMVRNKDAGSSIYFSLPVENAENREVYLKLKLKGDRVYVCPQLVLSRSENIKSTISVNGEALKQKADNLVFTSMYQASSSYNNILDAAFQGGMALGLGGLIFAWIRLYASKQKSKTDDAYTERLCSTIIYENETKERKKTGKIFGFFGVVILLGISMIFVYKYYVEEAIQKHQYYALNDVFLTELNCQNPEVSQDIILSYSETAIRNSSIDGMRIAFTTDKERKNAELKILLIDTTTGTTLADTEFVLSADSLAQKEGFLNIPFSETVLITEDHILKLEIKLENTTENLNVIFSNAEQNDAAVTLELNDNDFLLPLYRTLCVIIFGIVILIYFLCFFRPLRIENIFLVSVVSMGMIFGIVITLYGAPDEPSHIDTAYRISNEIMGIEESTKPGYIYKRAEDVDMTAEGHREVTVQSYKKLYETFWTKAQNETLVECAAISNLGNAGRIFYIPQAVGISLGRICGLGMTPTMLLGRLCALLCYGLLTYLSVKKIPFAKVTLCLIALLPISLQEAASFSYDAMINAGSFLFVSYALYFVYSDAEKIKGKDIAVILITGSLLATVKGGVYLPLCFLPLLRVFHSRKEMTGRHRVYTTMLCAFFLLIFLKEHMIATLTRLSAASGTAVGGSNATKVYTMTDFFHAPLRLIGICVNSLYRSGDDLIKNLLGGKLSWLDINIAWYVTIGFLILLLISCIPHEKERIVVKPGEKIYMGIISAGAFALIMLSMLLVWTPVTSQRISGLQGRYYLPFFILVLVILKSSVFMVKKDLSRYLLSGIVILNIITVLQIIQQVVALA